MNGEDTMSGGQGVSSTPPVLPYWSALPRNTMLLLASWVTLVLACLTLALLGLVISTIGRDLARAYKDFGLLLPQASKAVVSIPPLGAWAVVLVLAMAAVVKECLVPHKALTLTINCLLWMVTMTAMTAYWLLVQTPLYTLISPISPP